MSTPRSGTRGSVGDGGDPKLPNVHPSVGGLDADDELSFGDDYDPRDPWSGEDDRAVPLGERLDIWRRKYLPLPDEVVYEFLGEDEYVVHSDHPSFRAFLTQNIALVVLIPIIGPIFVWLLLREINPTTVTIFLLLDLIVAVLAFKRVGDRYTSYVITNLRLIKVTGIFSRKLASIPWTRMTGLGYFQSAWGRLMGYATIFIESANEESGLRNFSDVNDPATFHQRLLDMVSAKSGQSSAHPPAPTRGERRGLFSRRKEKKKMAARQAEVAASGTSAGPAAPGAPSRKDEPGGPAKTWGRPKATMGAGQDRPKVRGRIEEPGLAPGSPEAPGSPGAGGSAEDLPPPPPPSARPAGPDPASDTGGDETGADRDRPPGPGGQEASPLRPRKPPPIVTPPEEGPEPQKRSRLGGWFRWPGTGGGGGAPPVPPAPAAPRPSTSRAKPRRGPAQRAPSKAPPRTIVVPRTRPGQPPNPGGRSEAPPGWRRRVREIDG